MMHGDAPEGPMMPDRHTDNRKRSQGLQMFWWPVYLTLLHLAPDSPCPQRTSSVLPPSNIRNNVLWKEGSSFVECAAMPSAGLM